MPLLQQLATLTAPAALEACITKLHLWASEQESVAGMRDDLMALLEVFAMDRETFSSDAFAEFCKLLRVLLTKGAATCVCGEYFEHFYRRFVRMTPKRQRVALAYVMECLNRCDACVQSFRGRIVCNDASVDPCSFCMRSVAIHTLHRSHLLRAVPYTFRKSLVREFKLWEGVMYMEGMASLRWPVLELLVPTREELAAVDESVRSRVAEYLLAECTQEAGGAISAEEKPVAKRLAYVWMGFDAEEEEEDVEEVAVAAAAGVEEAVEVRSESAGSDLPPPSVDEDAAELTVDGDAVERGSFLPIQTAEVSVRASSSSTIPRELFESGRYLRAAAGAAYVPMGDAPHLFREVAPHKIDA